MLQSRQSSSSSKSTTTKPSKSLSTSINRSEAKTPEIETVSESRKKSSVSLAKKKTKLVSAPAIKSSPLSSRAQRVKQSLREKVEVLAVLLKEDGTSQEIKYNGSSKQAQIILGGRPTIIGEFEEIGVIIVRSLNQSSSGKKLNKTILPTPFCNKQFNGPYLLYKIGRDGIPSNFRLTEYVQFEKQNKGLTESARKNYNPIDDQVIKTKSSLSSNSSFVSTKIRNIKKFLLLNHDKYDIFRINIGLFKKWGW